VTRLPSGRSESVAAGRKRYGNHRDGPDASRDPSDSRRLPRQAQLRRNGATCSRLARRQSPLGRRAAAWLSLRDRPRCLVSLAAQGAADQKRYRYRALCLTNERRGKDGSQASDEGATVHRWPDASARRVGGQPLGQTMSFGPPAVAVRVPAIGAAFREGERTGFVPAVWYRRQMIRMKPARATPSA
jgi:hypothetical protein